MDCNKEEASRAKKMAEDLMRKGDFARAQKLVMKAQRLFSGLDGLPQMLAVCDVHCSAEKKINGLENWYGILQAMHFCEDATIRKQYRKLALLLHPDKNQFAGAEAAFKLIGEANRLLGDKEKRTQYDINHRIYSRVVSRQLNADSGLQCGSAHRNVGSTGPQQGNAAAEVDKKETSKEKPNKKGGGGENQKAEVRKSQLEKESMNCGESSKPTEGEGKMKHTAEPPKTDGLKPQPEAAEPEQSASKHVPYESVSRSSQAPSMSKDKKKRRKIVEEPEESTNVTFSDVFEDKSNPKDNNRRKSPQKSQQASYEEKRKSGDAISAATKRSKSIDGLKPQPKAAEPEQSASKHVPYESVSRSSQAPSMSKNKKKRRKIVEEPEESTNVTFSDVFEDKSYPKDNNRRKSPRKSQQASCEEKRKSGDAINTAPKRSKSNDGSSKHRDSGGFSSPSCNKKSKGNEARGEGITQDSPDQDFHNFELTTSCFAVNQVWSLYDPTDGMPRFYAQIRKVIDSEFKLEIMWLDPLQVYNENSIPVACGIFQGSESQEVDDPFIFSCEMLHRSRDNNIVIYPRTGEVWAVFRGWDISWKSGSSENHKGVYEYDFVEILFDFDDVNGVGVAYLGKVEGFVSLFHRDAKCGVLQFHIPPNEMLRFSHKVPSFKMTGRESEGVPPGCFELDIAALPKDMFDVANQKKDSVKKGKKSVKAVDGLKLRKSPRLVSETNKQETSRKSAKRGASCGKPNGSCVSDETTPTPKKPEKATTGNSKKRGRND